MSFPEEVESNWAVSVMHKLGLSAALPAPIKEENVFDTLYHQLAKDPSFQLGECRFVTL